MAKFRVSGVSQSEHYLTWRVFDRIEDAQEVKANLMALGDMDVNIVQVMDDGSLKELTPQEEAWIELISLDLGPSL